MDNAQAPTLGLMRCKKCGDTYPVYRFRCYCEDCKATHKTYVFCGKADGHKGRHEWYGYRKNPFLKKSKKRKK
jgi:hypothetical protein